MKKILSAATVLLALTFTACGGASTPAGSWDVDMTPFKEMMKQAMAPMLAMAPADNKAAMEKEMNERMARLKMTMEIKADGKFTAHQDVGDEHNEIAGTWKLDGDKLTMTGKRADGEQQTLTGTFQGDKIELTGEENGQKMTFNMTRK